MRVITYNTACGNPKISTPAEAFLDLPFYEEAMTDAPDAPIIALQEVGPAQHRALRKRQREHGFGLVFRGRPGQGNALIIPSRYPIIKQAAGYYGWCQARAYVEASRWANRRPYAGASRPVNHRQYLEARMWLMARLADGGREFSVFCTHLSGERPLREAQARVLAVRVIDASRRGPVIVAGDLNARARSPTVKAFEPLEPVTPSEGAIDWILALGLVPVSSRIIGEILSDHYPREAVLRWPD